MPVSLDILDYILSGYALCPYIEDTHRQHPSFTENLLERARDLYASQPYFELCWAVSDLYDHINPSRGYQCALLHLKISELVKAERLLD